MMVDTVYHVKSNSISIDVLLQLDMLNLAQQSSSPHLTHIDSVKP